MWKNKILLVSNNSKGKGQLKLLGLISEYRNPLRPCTDTALVDVRTKNKMFS
jgi:hypothetical protein